MKKKSIIIGVLLILLLLIGGAVVRIFTAHNWEVKSYERVHISVPKIEYNLSKAEARKLVKDLYNTPHIYNEKNLNGQLGRSLILYRVVEIQKGLSIDEYIITYAHELTHLKYWCANETYTMYKTIITLYESDNEILKNIAIQEVSTVLKGCYSGTEYDCGYYLIEYFKKQK